LIKKIRTLLNFSGKQLHLQPKSPRKFRTVEIRKHHNLSRVAFAKKIDVTQQVVAKWENRQCEPNAHSLKKIYECFGVTPNVILGIED